MEYVNYDVASVEDAAHSLVETGVAVLPNQFSEDECEGFRNEIWRDIRHVTQGRFDVEDEATWAKYWSQSEQKPRPDSENDLRCPFIRHLINYYTIHSNKHSLP